MTPTTWLANMSANRSCSRETGCPVGSLPIYGMVCRLTEQKGVHLLIPALDKFLQHQVQVVIVGSGDLLAAQLQTIAQQHPDQFAFINAYDDRLAHLVEAGADFFLMPSCSTLRPQPDVQPGLAPCRWCGRSVA